MGVSGQRHAAAAVHSSKRTGTHLVGKWVGPRASMDGYGYFFHDRDWIPGPSRP
jgi:hypothetical protein